MLEYSLGTGFGAAGFCFLSLRVLQVDTMDKAGNFIGWLFVDNVNMSVSLVESGLAKRFYTAETSPYCRELEVAESSAKQAKLGVWANYVEEIRVRDVTSLWTSHTEGGIYQVPLREVMGTQIKWCILT